MKSSRLSGLVITGQPLLMTKELAVFAGDRVAMFVQQSFFMISRYGKDEKDGERWLKWSIDKWHKRVFPFWSESTLHRILKEVEEKEWLTVVREPGATAKFAANLDKLEADFKGGRGVKLKPPQVCQNDTPQVVQNDTPVRHIERVLHRDKRKETTPLRGVGSNRKRFEASGSIAESRKKVAGKTTPLSATDVTNRVRATHRQIAAQRISEKPTIESLILFWRRLLSDHGVSSRTLSFNQKERGFIKSLLKQFTKASNGKGGTHLAEFLEFAVSHWAELKTKIVWDNNPNRSKLGKIPSFVEIYYNREDILHYMSNPQEVQTAKKKETVYTDLSQVPKDHPKFRQIAFMIKHDGKAVLQ